MQVPAFKIQFSEEERQQILARVDQILVSGKLSQGSTVQELEERFAEYLGVRYAVAVSSGSSAIEIALRILNHTRGEVLIPTNTFLATAVGVLFAGGKVRLVDTDPHTFAVSLNELKRRATEKTTGVIIVHIGGIIHPEIEKIRAWCDKKGYWLFEDAAHAHGSRLHGKSAGSFGIAGAYSFFATKVMTAGEGGMLVTNDKNLAEQFLLHRNHGKPEPWASYHTILSSNYRMSEVAATIAITQLSHLDEMIAERERIAARYTMLIEQYLPTLPTVLPVDASSWYKYIVMLPENIEREKVKKYMKDHGVSLAGEVYERPLHQQPALSYLMDLGSYPQADYVCLHHICLPIYPGLAMEAVDYVIQILAQCLSVYENEALASAATGNFILSPKH